MDRIVITRRLKPHIFNLCLAVIGNKTGDISLCKENLIYEVEKIVRDATRSAPTSADGACASAPKSPRSEP